MLLAALCSDQVITYLPYESGVTAIYDNLYQKDVLVGDGVLDVPQNLFVFDSRTTWPGYDKWPPT